MIEQATNKKSFCNGIKEAISLYSDDEFDSIREIVIYLVLNASYMSKNIAQEVIHNIITLKEVHVMLSKNLDLFEKKLIRKGERNAEKRYKDEFTAKTDNIIKQLVNYFKENGESFDESSDHISFIYEIPLEDAKTEVKKYWD